jgi:CRISPR system Cascade subunit CasB
MLPLEEVIEGLTDRLLGLDPGPLAELRRMEIDGPGTPVFWRLATQCGFSAPVGAASVWMRIVRILAILTPAGTRGSSVRLQERSRRLGAVLCDGGDPGWSASAQAAPVFSESRLARLMAMPAAQRGEALERAARMLATRRRTDRGLQCTDFARLLLGHNESDALRDLAQTYYQRLDSAMRNSKKEGNN